MKSKKALISLLATASLAALFSASSVTANAADNSNSTVVAKFDKAITKIFLDLASGATL